MANLGCPVIINVMPHGPACHYSPDEWPDMAWEKPDGTVVGFWPREWPDLLGEKVLKASGPYRVGGMAARPSRGLNLFAPNRNWRRASSVSGAERLYL